MPRPKVSLFCLSLLTVVLLSQSEAVIPTSPALAHQVELSKDIGGTLHIEPNDTPRAGEEVLAWVALTRKGGKTLALADCDCQMDVYKQPRQPDDRPVATPPSIAVEGEGSSGIPGARFTFPEVGAYTLVMRGQPPATAASDETATAFTPFELAFDVTVATGEGASAAEAAQLTTETVAVSTSAEVAQATENVPELGSETGPEKVPGKAPRGVAIVAIATGILAGLLSLFLWRRRQKS